MFTGGSVIMDYGSWTEIETPLMNMFLTNTELLHSQDVN